MTPTLWTFLQMVYRYTKALDNIKALRKERTADLKAEKERLESLSKEKGHCDRLGARIVELKASIATNKDAHQKAESQYLVLLQANQQLHDQAYAFTEKFTKFEQYENDKKRLQNDMNDLKTHLQILPGRRTKIRISTKFSPPD
jgi:DNA repair protein RAD50